MITIEDLLGYILKRLILLIPLLLGISLIVFLMVHLIPGDLVDILVSVEGTVSEEEREELRQTLGLHRPVHEQYLDWLSDVIVGDFGTSLRRGISVTEAIVGRLSVTYQLAFMSLILSILIGIPTGIISAIYRNSWLDYLTRSLALLGLSIPSFWLGTMMLLGFSLYFGWYPGGMYVSFFEDPLRNLRLFIFPAISLGAIVASMIMRMTRSVMLDVLRADYVVTARAKGLNERVVIYKHALKNALIPVFSVIGIQAGILLGGTVVIEEVFALSGIGRLVLRAIFERDYPMIQGVVLLIAMTYVFINLIVDILYVYTDPRVRYQ